MKCARKSAYFRAVFLLALIVVAVIGVEPALAHTRVEIGPYVVIVGWKTEPVVVGERNALLFDVTEDGDPVEGLEASLDVAVLYGGQTFRGNLEPTEAPGVYAVEILPTVRGQYSVQLAGAIEEVGVDEIIEPEEVLPARILQFPESPPDARDLQRSIEGLSDQLQTIRILAFAALGLGLIAVVIAVISLVQGRKNR